MDKQYLATWKECLFQGVPLAMWGRPREVLLQWLEQRKALCQSD